MTSPFGGNLEEADLERDLNVRAALSTLNVRSLCRPSSYPVGAYADRSE